MDQVQPSSYHIAQDETVEWLKMKIEACQKQIAAGEKEILRLSKNNADFNEKLASYNAMIEKLNGN